MGHVRDEGPDVQVLPLAGVSVPRQGGRKKERREEGGVEKKPMETNNT